MVKSETKSGFDFNKMYDDTKYEIKKRNEQRDIDKTRDKNKKRQEDEAAKKKRRRREKEK